MFQVRLFILEPTCAAELFVIYRSLISLSLLLTLVTVILSAYIRLADVGIGCETWPDCYAQLDPGQEKKGVTVLTSEGRTMAHYGARVAHRYIASTLGLFVLAVFVIALRQRRASPTGLWVPFAILATTLFLSLLGYYTPTRSNPLITMGNLVGGMTLLGLLWWLMQREAGGLQSPDNANAVQPYAALAMSLVVLQIILGGWSSANYASTSCPDLLQCEQALKTLPQHALEVFNPLRQIELDATAQVVSSDSLGLLSMAHRLFAILTAGYLAWMVRKLKPEPLLRTTILTLSVFSISQIIIGVSMIWLQLPLFMLTLHNALAAGLLLGSVNLLHRLIPLAGSLPPETPLPHPSD